MRLFFVFFSEGTIATYTHADLIDADILKPIAPDLLQLLLNYLPFLAISGTVNLRDLYGRAPQISEGAMLIAQA
jgi:hypothetical protein